MQLIESVTEFLADTRLPGEQVMHAVAAQQVGFARATAGRQGLLGKLLTVGQGDLGEIYGTELPVPPHAIVALTSHRLLIFQSKSLSIRPKTLVHDIPFARLAWMREATAGSGLAPVKRITLGVTDPAVLRWEYLRLNTPAGLALNADLRKHLPVG